MVATEYLLIQLGLSLFTVTCSVLFLAQTIQHRVLCRWRSRPLLPLAQFASSDASDQVAALQTMMPTYRVSTQHRMLHIVSIPILTIFAILCIDPLSVLGVLDHTTVNFLYNNLVAFIYCGLAVALNRSMRIYTHIARKLTLDVMSQQTQSICKAVLFVFLVIR